MTTVGIIGLGIMGRPMAKNLVTCGFSVLGTDLNPEFIAQSEPFGVVGAPTVAALAPQCDIIITLLPTPAASFAVALGQEGIAFHARPGTLVLEMSSLSPVTAKEIHAGLLAHSIAMMDAPVSGGEPKAIDGTLAIMAGGTKQNFERAKPVFAAMATTITHVGEVGAGCMAKLANQIMVAVNIAGVAEALTLAAKAGVDPALVFDAVRHGFAGSAVLDAKGPMMLDRNYTPGARLEIHIKDLVNVLETAHALAAPVPLTAQIMEMMQSLKAKGLGQIDHSGLVRYFEMLAGVEVKREGEPPEKNTAELSRKNDAKPTSRP